MYKTCSKTESHRHVTWHIKENGYVKTHQYPKISHSNTKIKSSLICYLNIGHHIKVELSKYIHDTYRNTNVIQK